MDLGTRLGREAGDAYETAYVLEKSLSIDNLAVFALVFSQTGIVGPLQRKVLMWVLPARWSCAPRLLRAGLFLLPKFQWIVYPFAALLLYAAVQMTRTTSREAYGWRRRCTLCSSWIAIPTNRAAQQGERFTVRMDGTRYATPLLVALVAVESADSVFAIDSVPAVFAVTQDPFLVYTSNMFALLGLRSMYAIVGNVFERFPYLRYALTSILVFVAIKLGASAFVHISAGVSLASSRASCCSLRRPHDGCPARNRCRGSRHARIATRTNDHPNEPAAPNARPPVTTWVSLRLCVTCGHVGCCDSSMNNHAEKHFQRTGHPIMRSLEPGERWRWCYIDDGIIAYD